MTNGLELNKKKDNIKNMVNPFIRIRDSLIQLQDPPIFIFAIEDGSFESSKIFADGLFGGEILIKSNKTLDLNLLQISKTRTPLNPTNSTNVTLEAKKLFYNKKIF
jgi:hypothetical protein